jgi:hypothetical protein
MHKDWYIHSYIQIKLQRTKERKRWMRVHRLFSHLKRRSKSNSTWWPLSPTLWIILFSLYICTYTVLCSQSYRNVCVWWIWVMAMSSAFQFKMYERVALLVLLCSFCFLHTSHPFTCKYSLLYSFFISATLLLMVLIST